MDAETLSLALRGMFHPHDGGDLSASRCRFCGARRDRAIHDLRTARRHGFDWTTKEPWYRSRPLTHRQRVAVGYAPPASPVGRTESGPADV